MKTLPFLLLKCVLLLLAVLGAERVSATHVVGGEITYKFLGFVSAGCRYQVNLSIYEDCLNGSPGAIASDNLAWLTINDGNGAFIAFDSVSFTGVTIVPANFSNACVSNIPQICLQRKDFSIDVLLPPNVSGYNITYQRCCRNAAVVNIKDPANIGTALYCTIPPLSVATGNNSAVFTNFPPQIICVNTPLVYNHSATDADGDSLTYELCNSYMCLNGANVDLVPFIPPYTPVTYISPYTYSFPMTAYPLLQIDARTGIISGTPNRVGRYLVTVCCNEWRNGVLINTVKREFQFVVTDCSKLVVADIPIQTDYPNTFQLNCKNHTIHFINKSIGGYAYHWDFGVPGNRDTSDDFEPTFVYPDTGTYAVKLVVNPGGTCPDSVIRLVRIYPTLHAEFTTNHIQCVGSKINFIDQTVDSFKPGTKWKWYFGDGDSTLIQNPTHVYTFGGNFVVVLAAENSRDCRDTVLHQIPVDNFNPFAGNDTTIVKGSTVQFNATGGTGYVWSPPVYLESVDTYNPLGYFPDAGSFTYAVNVTSPYGCIGTDSIHVTVVNQAAFVMPNAFTPNGDGLNDLFMPRSVGYSMLNYFRIFNRWGEEVFFTTSLETGWDGTHNSKPCDLGTYYWEIGYKDRFGKDGTMKGDVTLVR